MGPKALARAARWAIGVDDATTVFGVDVDATADAYARIRKAWADAGRDDAPHISASLWYALGHGAEERLRSYCFDYMRLLGDELAKDFASMTSCHNPGALRSAVEALDHLGCDELFLVPTTTDVRELDRTRDALGI
jgi:hypothetical protein